MGKKREDITTVIERVRHRLKIVISKAVIHEVVYPFLSYICLLFKNGGIAQLARALAWHARGHRFESDYLHNVNPGTIVKQRFQDFLFHFSPPLAHI